MKDNLIKLDLTSCNFPNSTAGYWRLHYLPVLHENSVTGEIDSNAFHKHLEIHHKEKKGDLSVFKVKVESLGPKQNFYLNPGEPKSIFRQIPSKLTTVRFLRSLRDEKFRDC